MKVIIASRSELAAAPSWLAKDVLVGRRYHVRLTDGTLYQDAAVLSVEDGDLVVEAIVRDGPDDRLRQVYIPASEFDRAEEVSK